MKLFMKTIGLICMACLFLGIGYFLGIHAESLPLAESRESSVTGVYHTDSWNGQSNTLILYEDGSCQYPSYTKAHATWQIDGNIVTINLEGREHEANVVEEGLILYDAFFEKMD